MQTTALSIPGRGRSRRSLANWAGGRRVQDWVRPAIEVAIAAAIILGIIGVVVMYRFGGSGGGGANLAASSAPNSDQAVCTTQSRSAESIVNALSVSDVLTLNGVDLGATLGSAYEFSIPPLPGGVAADKPTSDAIGAVWAQYQACMSDDPSKAFGLLTDNALRRLFYSNVWDNLNQSQVGLRDQKLSRVSAIGSPVVPYERSPTAEDVTAAKAGSPQLIGQSSLTVGAGKFVLGEMRVLPEGSVFVELKDPARSIDGSAIGYAVFTKSNTTWLIDSILIFVG